MQEAFGSCPKKPRLERPGACGLLRPLYSLRRQSQKAAPFLLGTVLSLGHARREACVRELKVNVLGRHCG